MTRPDHEETIFTWGAPALKFGVGAADEIGFDLSGFGVRRVLVVTDAAVLPSPSPSRIADALRRYDINAPKCSTGCMSKTDRRLDDW